MHNAIKNTLLKILILIFYLWNSLMYLQLCLSSYYESVSDYLLIYCISVIIVSFGIPGFILYLLWENQKLHNAINYYKGQQDLS